MLQMSVSKNVHMNRCDREIDNAKCESDQVGNLASNRRDGVSGIACVRDAHGRDAESNGNPGYRERPAVHLMPCGFAAERG